MDIFLTVNDQRCRSMSSCNVDPQRASLEMSLAAAAASEQSQGRVQINWMALLRNGILRRVQAIFGGRFESCPRGMKIPWEQQRSCCGSPPQPAKQAGAE